MAQESAGDWFGFAELSDDFVPSQQQQTNDSSNTEIDSGTQSETDPTKDEKGQSQVKSILKGSSVSDDNGKEDQNKKRRISFTDYLSRVKKVENTKANDEQKQTKVPVTLPDENKTITEIKPDSIKSPEIVIDENMYEINKAAESWHSFTNIKKGQERAPTLKKNQRSVITKKPDRGPVTNLEAYMSAQFSSEDSTQENNLSSNQSKAESDAKRFVSMPLTKKSDIFTLEKTMNMANSGGTLIPSDSKATEIRSSEKEQVEQDDVLSVFDSLFSLGETVLNLKKSLPEPDFIPKEEGSLFSALDTLCKVGKDIVTSKKSEVPVSDTAAGNLPVQSSSLITDSLASKLDHIPELIDLTDEPERCHRPLFLNQQAWILQSASAEDISVEKLGDDKELCSNYSDPGYYFDKMGSFSGIYLSRFRYNITAFESMCKNLGDKTVVEKKIPAIRTIAVALTDTDIASIAVASAEVNTEQECSFEQDSVEVTEGGNEDYMDDDYADMLAAAQLALNEEAQHQNIVNIDVSTSTEADSHKDEEDVKKKEEAGVMKSKADEKDETSTGEAVELLNNLVNDLSADIETFTDSPQPTAGCIEKSLAAVVASPEIKKMFVENIECLPEENMIDSVLKQTEIVFNKTIEQVSHSQQVRSSSTEKESTLKEVVKTYEKDIENNENSDLEKLGEPKEILQVENTDKSVNKTLICTLQMPASDLIKESNKGIQQENKKEKMNMEDITTDLKKTESNEFWAAEEETGWISNEDQAVLIHKGESEPTKTMHVEGLSNTNQVTLTQTANRQQTDDEQVSSKNIPKEIVPEEVAGCTSVLSYEFENAESESKADNKIVLDSMETLVDSQGTGIHSGNKRKNEKLPSENVNTEDESVDLRGNAVVLAVVDKEASAARSPETEQKSLKDDIPLAVGENICAVVKEQSLNLETMKDTEKKITFEMQVMRSKDMPKAQEKRPEQQTFVQQSSLVSMDYDTISDGSFSGSEMENLDKRKMSKPKLQDTGLNGSFRAVSLDAEKRSNDRLHGEFPKSIEGKPDKIRKSSETEPCESRQGADAKKRDRRRSDSWDAASYRVEHKERKKKRKDSSSDSDEGNCHKRKSEKKRKKKNQTPQIAISRHKSGKEEKENRNDLLPQEKLDYGTGEESKRYRRGKEFIDETKISVSPEQLDYGKMSVEGKKYRKGKEFVEEDDYEDYETKMDRNEIKRQNSAEGSITRTYEHNNEHYEYRGRREQRNKPPVEKKGREYLKENHEYGSLEARDYRVKKDKKKHRRKMFTNSDGNNYDDNKRKKGKHSKVDQELKLENELSRKKKRKSSQVMESDDEKYVKNDKWSETKRKTGDIYNDDKRRKSFEAKEFEILSRETEENISNKVEKDTDSLQQTQTQKIKGGSLSKDKLSKSTAEAEISESDYEENATDKRKETLQEDKIEYGKSTRHKDIPESKIRKSVERKDSVYENEGKQTREGDSEHLSQKAETDNFAELKQSSAERKCKKYAADETEVLTRKCFEADECEDDDYEKRNEKVRDIDSQSQSGNKTNLTNAKKTEVGNPVKEKKRREENESDNHSLKKKEKLDYQKNRSQSKDRKKESSKGVIESGQKYDVDKSRSRLVSVSDDEEYYEKRKGKDRSKERVISRMKHDDDECNGTKKKNKTRESRMFSEDRLSGKSEIRESNSEKIEETKQNRMLDERYNKELEKMKEKEAKSTRKSKEKYQYKTTKERKKEGYESISDDEYFDSKKKSKEKDKYMAVSDSEEEHRRIRLKKKDKSERRSKISKSSDSEQEENKNVKKKDKEKWKAKEEARCSNFSGSEQEQHLIKKKEKKEKPESSDIKSHKSKHTDIEYENVHKMDRKKYKDAASDVEYYYGKHKIKKNKSEKYSDVQYSKDRNYYERKKKQKGEKEELSEENSHHETEINRKRDKKRRKTTESNDLEYYVEEKEKRKKKERRDSQQDVRDCSRERRKGKSMENEDELCKSEKAKKKDKKKRKSVESDIERENQNAERKKRTIYNDEDDDDHHRQEKKKIKKRRKSNDSENLQNYDQKEKVKGSRHLESSEKFDHFEKENESRRHRKRSHSHDSSSLSSEHSYDFKKGKILASSVKLSKGDKYEKDGSKVEESKYDRDEYRKDRYKYRSERNYEKYDTGKLDKGDLRYTLKSKKSSR